MLIDNKLLERYGACLPQRVLFNERFPKGLRITRRTNIDRLAPKLANLNLVWAAEYLLTVNQRDEFYLARRTAREAYNNAIYAARGEYGRAQENLDARPKYVAARNAAARKYDRVVVETLVRLLTNK